jgi:hypothetical protein
MIGQRIERIAYAAVLAVGTAAWSAQAAEDPLPSWNDGARLMMPVLHDDAEREYA